MSKIFSRRQLARYAADELLANRRPAQLAVRLAAALAASGKRKETELLLNDIDQELEDRSLLAKACVTTARPLTSKLKQELTAHIQKTADVKEVVLIEQIDKDIIGGIRIETANHMWDKTLKTYLMKIKETI